MNKKLDEFKKDIRTKKVAVLGMGISNTPLLKYLAGLGVDLTAFDMASEEKLKSTLEQLKGLNIKYSLGPGYLECLKGFDVIFKTPKVRFDIPELLRESARGALVTSEMEVFIELCPAEIFAVTGSDGKTTTTTLIYNMLMEEGYNCWLGGNIGTPLLDKIDEVKPTDKVVLELSSFQLHTMRRSPEVAVVTNLSPNHLDVHKSMEEYSEAKKNIFIHQKPDGKVILNYDNAVTREYSKEAPGKVVFFSRKEKMPSGAMTEEGKVVYVPASSSGSLTDGGSEAQTRKVEIMAIDDIRLPGVHNLENYLAAAAAVIDYVKPEAIRKVAVSFTGVEHRMEPVREIGGVKFFNDSIGSSPTRTIMGLNAFDHKVVLIAGGYDKHIPYDEMGEVIVRTVKKLVLMGPTGPKIKEALDREIESAGKGRDIDVLWASSMEEAVQKAYSGTSAGDSVVLSPASASFDLFSNFEERGNRFKEIVNNL